jgi:hypothetical protein
MGVLFVENNESIIICSWSLRQAIKLNAMSPKYMQWSQESERNCQQADSFGLWPAKWLFIPVSNAVATVVVFRFHFDHWIYFPAVMQFKWYFLCTAVFIYVASQYPLADWINYSSTTTIEILKRAHSLLNR